MSAVKRKDLSSSVQKLFKESQDPLVRDTSYLKTDEELYSASSEKSICTISCDEHQEELEGAKLNTTKSRSNVQLAEANLEGDFDFINVVGDGNYFYRAILVALGQNEDNHFNLRNLACTFLETNINLFVGEAYSEDEIRSYVNKNRENGQWARNLIIYSTALMLSICIKVFSPGYAKSINFNEESNEVIYLFNSNRDHFQALIPSDNKKISKSKKLLNFSEDMSEKILNLSEKSKMKIPQVLMQKIDLIFPKDGKSIYNEIFTYLTSNKLPDKVLSKQEIKPCPTSHKTQKGNSIYCFRKTCKNYYIAEEKLSTSSFSNLVYISEFKKKDLVIPYESEIPNLIMKAHTE